MVCKITCSSFAADARFIDRSIVESDMMHHPEVLVSSQDVWVTISTSLYPVSHTGFEVLVEDDIFTECDTEYAGDAHVNTPVSGSIACSDPDKPSPIVMVKLTLTVDGIVALAEIDGTSTCARLQPMASVTYTLVPSTRTLDDAFDACNVYSPGFAHILEVLKIESSVE